MSWAFSYFLGGGQTAQQKDGGAELSEETDAERQRTLQIQSLRSELLGVSELERDERYRVEATVRGEPLTLEIYLPGRFPLVSPEVFISQTLHHPWVSGQKITNCPLLQNFSVHSNLGHIIRDIIQELNVAADTSPAHNHTPTSTPSIPAMTSPHFQPAPVGSYQPFVYTSMPQPSLPPRPTPSSSSSSSTIPRPRRVAPPPPRSTRTYSVPPVPADFPDIKSMTDDELKKYLDETEGTVPLRKYVEGLDGVKKVQADRAVLFQENEDQAQINLGHEPELQEGWAQLQEKYFEMLSQKEKYDKLLQKQLTVRTKYIDYSKTASSQLKTLAQEAETESDIIAEDFLEGKVQVTEFLRSFMERRTLHHKRKSKQEMLVYKRY